MKIGVISSGDVGQVLATGFPKHGHEVAIGTRDPTKLAGWAKATLQGRPVRVGHRRHGQRGGRTRDRAALHAVMHPGFLRNQWTHAFKLLK